MNKKMICFPCAGGSARNFKNLLKNIECSAICVEYSGHWSRYEEPLYDSMETCVQCLTEEIQCMDITADDEIVLLGHSMGALIAFEIGKRLVQRGYHVGSLFLLACMSPDEMDCSKIEFADDEAIKMFLKQIRQVPERVLNSNFFMENLLPSIRNDFRLLSNFARDVGLVEAVNLNIVCLYGNQDMLVDTMDGWKKYSNREIRSYIFPGNHFFFYDVRNEKKIAYMINSVLNDQEIFYLWEES